MVPLVRRFLVAAAVLLAGVAAHGQARVRQALPVPDLPGFRTLKADFHLHTVFSDGNVWPTVHVQEAWRDGLDVIALTEHAEYHPHTADVKVDGGRSYAIAKPLADQLGVILVPGVEITKPDPPAPLVLAEGSQHFNALFVTDANALNVPNDLMEALRRAKAQQAFVFWNHPGYRVASPRWFAPIARAFEAGLFQGMELVNGPDFYDDGLPVDCGAEAHDSGQQRRARSDSAPRRRLPPADHAALRANGRSRRRARRAHRPADRGLAGRRSVGRGRVSARDLEWRDRRRGVYTREESDPARSEHVGDPDAPRGAARTGVAGLRGTADARCRTGHRAPPFFRCRRPRRRTSSRDRDRGVEPARRAGTEPDRHDAADSATVENQGSDSANQRRWLVPNH